MAALFEELGLLPELAQTVEAMGYEQPTPIQLDAIPALLQGRNVIGQAQTGTGKTAAFGLPLLQQIQPHQGHIQALVLEPTRELAIQVTEALERMGSRMGFRVLSIYGGQPYGVQIRQLNRGVDVVVGTPGRLLDLIGKGLLDLSSVRFVVLDEADEMLEMGFIEDVEAILAKSPSDRQTALFSATMPSAVRRLADRYLTDPHEIRISAGHLTVPETEQRYCRVREDTKLAALAALLEVEVVKSALVFSRTKAGAQELSDALNRRGYASEALHGDLNQARREAVLNRFRAGTVTLLVATDVAARGLDIDDISHVFNYDLPDDVEDYVHRIGRTGRAGRKGVAISFLTPRERGRLSQIEVFTRSVIKECKVPTRDEILARRDERFLDRIFEQLGVGSNPREEALVNRLKEADFDPLQIAAAAIHMARAGELELPAIESRPLQPERALRRASERLHRDDNGSRPRRDDSEPRQPSRKHTGEKEPGMVRLVMNLGNANGIRPSDVVGAIAGEVGIPGRAIGVIDIHSDHTFVDVAEKHVHRVLQESTGKYMLRGQPVLLTQAD